MKVLTWNTQWCCGLDGVVSSERIVRTARSLIDFDVLCLQEIAQGFDDMPGAPGDQPAQLQALLPGFRLFFGAAVDEFSSDGRRMRFGNLIATHCRRRTCSTTPCPGRPTRGSAACPGCARSSPCATRAWAPCAS